MTATEMLDKFITTLDGHIEGALACLQNADAFQSACDNIEQVISDDLQVVMQALNKEGFGKADKQQLEECLARLVDLESRSRARGVWAQDFGDYIRRSASEDE